jgi:AGZA family xanthine/uracil permease-like MFS transporter
VLASLGESIDSFAGTPLATQLQTMQMLSGGFIVTSLLWGAALAALIDRRLHVAAAYFAVAGVCSLFGVIHSPFADERLLWPWDLGELPAAAAGQTPVYMAAAYFLVAILLLVWATRREVSATSHETL